jgi:hypothetical protein
MKLLINAFPILLQLHGEEVSDLGLCVLYFSLHVLNKQLLAPFHEFSLFLADLGP